MNFDTTASDRMQVRSQGELLAPGTCILCGSGNCDEGYLDVGVFVDFLGQIYFCMSHCVKQFITTVGGLPIEETQYLQEQANDLIRKNLELVAELEAANELIGQWNAVVNSIGSVSSAFDPLIVPNGPTSVEDASQDGQQATEPESGPVEQVSVVAKPSTGKRPPKPSKSTASNGPGFAI